MTVDPLQRDLTTTRRNLPAGGSPDVLAETGQRLIIRAPAPFTLPRGWVASGASGSLVSAVVTERGLDVA
jgi:hypothetical protein